MHALPKRMQAAAIGFVLVAALLATQAAADTLAPSAVAGQGRVIGRAGFAYVATLRRFAAAVLWNRLEPQFHEYYNGATLEDMTFVLPNTRIIVALDPELVEPYYVAPYILLKRGKTAEAFELAAEGVRNNPYSGRLHASFAQILQIGGDLKRAEEQADLAAAGAHWTSATEAHQGLAQIRGVYRAAGKPEKEQVVLAEIERVDREYGNELPAGEHDHDGDGKPDH